MNLVLLLNLVIAILSDTYSKFSAQSRGLFYDGMVAAIPAYNYDKFYGGMIIAAPPFNIFVLPFLPIYLCIKDKKRLLRINETVCSILFLPYSIIYLIMFTVFDLIMLPFAYFYSLVHKMRLLCMPKTYRSK